MTIRAAVLRERGLERPYVRTLPLEVADVSLAGPRTGELLVRVRAAGLCHSDLSVIDGSRPRPLPMVIGHEGAGTVEAVGPDVEDFAPGDHVVFTFVPACGRCVPCASGRPALCENGARTNAAGTLLSGARPFSEAGGSPLHHHLGVSAFAESTVVAAASCVRVDPALPLDKAALFGCALLTGVGAVINTAQVAPGSSVAVFGLGGVGQSAILGAVLAGAYPVIAVDPFERKRELALSLGATHAVAAGEDAVEAVRALTGGGAEVAVEAVGSAAVLAQAYAATRRGGTTVAVGLPHPSQTLTVPAVSIVAEERRIVGSYMGSAVPRRDVPRLVSLYMAGRLPVDALQSAKLSLEDVNAGFDALAGGETVRQVIVFA